MLKHRIIAGTLMIAVLVGLLYADERLGSITLGDSWKLPTGLLLFALVALAQTLASWELQHMFASRGIEVRKRVIVVGCVVTTATMYLRPAVPSLDAMAVLATELVLVWLWALVWHSVPTHRTQGAIAVGGATMMAILYAGILPGFLLMLRAKFSAFVIVAVVLITKSLDIGAYLTGRAIGQHKLIPWLSPGKTWEGLVGGLILAAVVSGLLALLSNEHQLAHQTTGQIIYFPPLATALSGACLALFGHAGDLLASLLKRDAGVKDSGHLVPGFGGVIDVVDSPLITAPLAYWILISIT